MSIYINILIGKMYIYTISWNLHILIDEGGFCLFIYHISYVKLVDRGTFGASDSDWLRHRSTTQAVAAGSLKIESYRDANFVHDDVIKWKHFRRYWPFVRGIHRSSEFPAQRPVTRSFDAFFDLHPNKRLSKQPWGWWFETPSWSLWRQCNVVSCGTVVYRYDNLLHLQKGKSWCHDNYCFSVIFNILQ